MAVWDKVYENLAYELKLQIKYSGKVMTVYGTLGLSYKIKGGHWPEDK